MSTLDQMVSGNVEPVYCDFHRLYRQKVYAVYFGVTTEGITAHMCENCFQDFGVGLDGGLGQKLGEDLSE